MILGHSWGNVKILKLSSTAFMQTEVTLLTRSLPFKTYITNAENIRANNYQNGQSERILGEWMEKRGIRDQMVLATKYTTPYRMGKGDKEIIINTGGNGTKSLKTSVAVSLKNLRSDYIDLVREARLYVSDSPSYRKII